MLNLPYLYMVGFAYTKHWQKLGLLGNVNVFVYLQR